MHRGNEASRQALAMTIDDAQERISRKFFGRHGVHAVTAGKDERGQPILRVYLEEATPEIMAEIREEAGDVPVEFHPTPPAKALHQAPRQ